MMRFLIPNVRHNGIPHTGRNSERTVTILPAESLHVAECFMDPFATVGFYRSHELRQRDLRADDCSDMKMIGNAVDRQRDPFVIADNTSGVLAYSGDSLGGQGITTFFR